MPKNIILRNLSPSMAKGPSIPIVSTHANQRDGTRNTSPGGYDNDPRFDGDTFQPRVLGQNGGGTTDTKFSMEKFNYLGAFRVRGAIGNDKNFRALAFNPPNGSNGINGSLFMSDTPNGVYEYEIPTTLSQEAVNYGLLPNATLLQQANFDLIDMRVTQSPFNLHNRMGWMQVVNGKLITQSMHSYQAGNTAENIVVFPSTVDLSGQITNNSYLGPFPAEYADKTSRYISILPEPWASTFGATHFAGVYNDLSVVSRASLGPSFYAFNAGEIDAQTSIVNFTQYAQYPDFGGVAGFDKYNDPVLEYYESLVDMQIESWSKLDIALSNPEPENNTSSAPADTQYRITDITVVGTSTVISDACILADVGALYSTILVKSDDGLTTYVEGTDYTIELYTYQKSASFTDVDNSTTTLEGANSEIYVHPMIKRIQGGAISSDEVVRISYDYLTARYKDLTEYEPPASTLGATHGTYIVSAGCAFVVPGTDTVAIIGKNGAMRYGAAYKAYQFDNNTETSSGQDPVDSRDFDNWIWLMNLNDLYNAANPEDPEFYYSGVFDNNRWKVQGTKDFGTMIGGTYDHSTNRLYLAMRFPEWGQELAGSDTVIAVYEYA